MKNLTLTDIKTWEPTDTLALAPRSRQLYMHIASLTAFHFLRKLLPTPIHLIYRLWEAIPFLRATWRSLRQGKLNVPVLDAAAISSGFVYNVSSSGETMYLLKVSDALEEYTQKRGEGSLAQSLLDIPTTAHVIVDGQDIEISVNSLRPGDVVVVRLGDPVPVDGDVVWGEAAINQATLTGESMSVVRMIGDRVYAGTAVEEGETHIKVVGNPEESKIRSIIAMMDQADSLKSVKPS